MTSELKPSIDIDELAYILSENGVFIDGRISVENIASEIEGLIGQNTSATPTADTLAGLVRYRLAYDKYVDEYQIVEHPEGAYVLHSEAAAVVAALRKREEELADLVKKADESRVMQIKRAEAAEAELAISKTERHADGEYIGSLEAELAQIKAQEPVAWMHPDARWTDVSKQEVAVHCKVGTYPLPLYDAPVSDSLKAECDRYKEALGLCQRTLAMIIDPKSIVSTTSIIAFASATEAEAKARTALKGESNV